MKKCLFKNTNISETKRGAKKKCIKSMEQMAQSLGHTQVTEEVPSPPARIAFKPLRMLLPVQKMFVRVRDTAANVMYYAMGKFASFLRREC